jgi:hypothetical protein
MITSTVIAPSLRTALAALPMLAIVVAWTGWASIALAVVPPTGSLLVGSDDFTYPDGTILGLSGGTGWEWNATAQAQSAPPASAYTQFQAGRNDIVNNQFRSFNNGGLARAYTGDTVTLGGINTGVVYFSTTMERVGSFTTYSGISSMEGTSERVFFGVPSDNNTLKKFGIAQSGSGSGALNDGPGVGTTLSGGNANTADPNFGIIAAADTSYTMVGVIDFDNDLLGLFINPDVNDFWSGLSNSADVTRPYTASNFSNGVRLRSGGGNATNGVVIWDNLAVYTGASVPEPAALGLVFVGGGAGLLTLVRRLRRRN